MLKGLIEALDRALVGVPDWVAIPTLLGAIAVSGVVWWRVQGRHQRTGP